MRKAGLQRKTLETDIQMEFAVDGRGQHEIQTGIGFFDHMLTHIAKHGFFDIQLSAKGDTHVDCHHTVEDVGIVLGQCIRQALRDKKGIRRYGSCMLPMEEALVLCAVDISARPLLCFDVDFTIDHLGGFDLEMVEEFFRAVSLHAGLNLHIKMLTGKNNHHMAEAIFKAFGKAMDEATAIDSRIEGVLSTKGML